MLIGKTSTNVIPRPLEDLEKSKSIISSFVKNNLITSAILVEISQKKTKVQLIKGKIEEFKETLDKECPGWEEDKKIINLAA